MPKAPGSRGLGALALLAACGDGADPPSAQDRSNSATAVHLASIQACASTQAVNGVKKRLFDDARAVPGTDAEQIAALERGTVARIVQPVVDHHDSQAGRTICSARLVLDLPPGREPRVDAQPTARIRYSSQVATDGERSAYEVFGGEPLVLRISQRAGVPAAAAAARTPPANPIVAGSAEAVAGESGSIWDHNGSRVRLQAAGDRRTFVYAAARAGVPARPGNVLFSGERRGSAYRGTAYLFSSRCGRIGYAVAGNVSADDRQITLRGNAPQRDRRSCRVLGYGPDELVFRYIER